MRRVTSLLLLMLMLTFTWVVNAQVSLYTFQSSSGTYTPITGGTVHLTGAWDDAQVSNVALGFNFMFNGVEYSTISINPNGYLIIGGGTTTMSYTPISNTTAVPGSVSAIGRDLQGIAVTGEVRSELTGTAGDYVFVVQWTDAKRYGTSYPDENLDFQIKLYENGGIAEFVYGPMTGSAYTSPVHPQVGLRGATNADYTNRTTTTDWAATTAGIINTATCTLTNLVYPADGLTFTFTPPDPNTPLPPTDPVPANAAVEVPLDGSLSWTFGANSVTYDLMFGPAGNMTEVVTGATAGATGTYDYVGLTNSALYQWRVVEHNGELVTYGPVWNFYAECAPFSIPFAENFNGVTTPALPICWSKIVGNTTNTFVNVETTTLNPNSPPYCAKMYNSGADTANLFLISPMIADPLVGNRVTFFARGGVNYSLLVGTMSDPTDPATFTQVSEVFPPGAQTAFQVSFADYAGTDSYIAFKHGNMGTTQTIYIDDVVVEVLPDCVEPALLTVASITNSSADLGWTSQGEETMWDVAYGDPGFDPDTEGTIVPASTNPYTLGELASATPYEFYVRADCGTDAVSVWAGPKGFTTACDVFELPYMDDFTGGVAGTFPACWSQSGLATTNWSLSASANALGVAPELRFSYSPSFTGESYMVSPLLNTTGETSVAISFKHFFDYYAVPFTIGMKTTSDGINWNTVWEVVDPTANIGPEALNIVVDNTDVGSATFQFAFWLSGYTFNMDNWYIDDISVSVPSFGNLDGYVTEATRGVISNAHVFAGDYEAYTDETGYYLIEGIFPGTYDVTCEAEGYMPVTVEGILIVGNETVTQDFELGYAQIAVNPSSLEATLQPEGMTTQTLTISNPAGTEPLNWSAAIELLDPVTSNNFAGQQQKDAFSRDFTQTTQVEASLTGNNKTGYGTDDFTTCPDGSIFGQIVETVNWGVATSEAEPAYACYQYFSNVTSPIGGMTFWGGNLIFSGAWAACGTEDPMAFTIKFYADDAGVPGAEIASFSPTITRVSTGIPLGTYGDFYMYQYTFGDNVNLSEGWVSVVGQTASPNCWFMWAKTSEPTATPYLQWDGTAYSVGTYGLSLCFAQGTTWLSLNEYSGTINPGESQDVTVTFDAAGLIDSTYLASINITHNGMEVTDAMLSVPATLIVASPDPPGLPTDPSPVAGATFVPLQPDFSWTNGLATAQVRFVLTKGTGPFAQSIYSSPWFVGNSVSMADVGITLLKKTSYNWRVYAKNAAGTTVGTSWTFQTVGAGSISGIITDSYSGATLEGATISVDDGAYTTLSLADGTYTLADVIEGSHTVLAELDGYNSQEQMVTVVHNQIALASFALDQYVEPPVDLTAEVNDFVDVHLEWFAPGYTPGGGGVIFEDDFEAYTAGGQLACQNPTDWTTWSNAPCGAEDAFISNLFAHSGVNSAVIAPNNDLVKDFGDPLTSGKYKISFWAYIPTGSTGYFNTLQDFVPAGTTIWGLEVYFNAAGAGSINANGTATATFTWVPDVWFKVEHLVDLDADYSEISIGGNMIYSYQWSLGATGTGQNTLDANDFFGAAPTDQMYFDDYKLEDMAGGTVEELIYDNDVTTGAYSYVGYTMSTHMSPSGPCKLLAMKFYTTIQTGDNTFNATLFDWAGTQPGVAILYQQNVTAVDDNWLEVDVSTQNLSFTGDFVVGFGSTNEFTFIGYDANLDNGRSWDFDNASPSWSSWNEAYLIRAIVQYPDGTLAEIGGNHTKSNSIVPSMVKTEHPRDYSGVNPVEPIQNSVRAAFEGYNVYRDGEFLAYTTDLFYDDLGLAGGTYDYTLTAVYAEGESEAIGPATVIVLPAPVLLSADADFYGVDLVWEEGSSIPLDQSFAKASTSNVKIDALNKVHNTSTVNPNIYLDGGRAVGDSCLNPAIAVEGLNTSPGAPYWYEFTLADDMAVTISSCIEGQVVDTDLEVYDACDGNLVAANDDLLAACGSYTYSSGVTFNGTAGVTYKILWLDTWESTGFDFTIDLSTICVVECPAGALTEPELCGEDLNGGCNADVPAWTPISNGDVYCGTAYAEDGRDTDWYELVLDAPKTVTWTATAEFPVLIFIINGNAGCDGLSILTSATAAPCGTATATATVPPGTYWLWVGNQTFAGNPCGGFNNYVASVTCEDAFLVHYNVLRDGEGIAEVYSGNTYRDEAITNGETYCYTVSQIVAPGIETPESNELCAEVPLIPTIEVTPESFSKVLEIGEVAADILTVANLGAGNLEFNVALSFASKNNASAFIPVEGALNNSNDPNWMLQEDATDVAESNSSSGSHQAYSRPLSGNRSVLYDNGGLITGECATTLAPESMIQAPGTSYGSSFNSGGGYSAADDFTVPTGIWNIDSFEFFGYQTNSTTTSTFTAAFVQIWDGNPMDGGTVVWGDLITNRMTSTEFSGIYRISGTGTCTVARPVMSIVASTPGLSLEEGTYWVEVSALGSLASGPWIPPVTIIGQPGGNALQGASGVYTVVEDPAGSGNYHEWPFIINGSSVVPWLAVSPEYGMIDGVGQLDLDVTFTTGELPYGMYYADIIVSSNDPLAPVTTIPVEMEILINVGTITGLVTDATAKGPVAGVTITADELRGFTTTTGIDGTYSLDVPPGVYTLTASKTGYVEQMVTLAPIAIGETITQNFMLEFSNPVLLSATPDYTGVVLEWQGNPAIAPYGGVKGAGMSLSNLLEQTVSQDKEELMHGPTSIVPAGGSSRATGDDCTDPIIIGALPYTDANTTCGRGNTYSETCLGSYDGGEDIVYQIVLTEEKVIEFTLTTTDTWTGMLVTAECPIGANCVASVSGSTGNKVLNATLAAGTYYLMIDTWPTPDCISAFTLDVAEVVLEPGETCETAFDYGNVGDAPVNGAIASYGVNWYSFTADVDYAAVDVSLCGSAFDTKMEVWYACDDAAYAFYNDDFCGLQSAVTTGPMAAGETWFVKVYGYTSAFGDYTLTITGTEPCYVECPAGALDEGEPCGEDLNGGCNADPVAYTPIANGDVYCGTAWADGDSRDTDWYELVLDTPTIVTWSVTAEFPVYAFIIDGNVGCEDAYIIALGAGLPCEEAVATATVPPGTYWLWVGNQGGTGNPCGAFNNYVAQLTCEDTFISYFNVFRNGEDVADVYNTSYYDGGLTGGNYCYTVNQVIEPSLVTGHSNELCADVVPLAQTIVMPQGWSAWSSYINPDVKMGMEGIMEPVINEMIVTQYFNQLYYPAYGINNMGDFSNNHGYLSKMTDEVTLEISGSMAAPTVSLSEGWNLMSVLQECSIPAADVFANLPGLVIAWDPTGNGIYYPAYSIYTLTDLMPGKAYWVKVDADASYTYPGCVKSNGNVYSPSLRAVNNTSWNDVNYTAINHAMVFDANAVAGLQAGDMIGAFTSEGICAGLVEFTGEKFGFNLFGDDITTEFADGFVDGEHVSFRLFRPATEEEFDIDVTYSYTAPNADGLFAINGVSVITDLKLSPTSIGANLLNDLTIYPNPSSGIFNIAIGNVDGDITFVVMNAQGQEVYKGNLLESQELDLSAEPKGVYFIKFMNSGVLGIEKLVIK